MHTLVGIYFILGVIITYVVVKNPASFINLFIASIIIGSGPMIFGYPFVDEYMLSMLLLGVFLRFSLLKNRVVIHIKGSYFNNLHIIAFYSLIAYFLFQSFRGLVLLGDIRMIRWILFFIIIGWSSNIILNYKFSISPKQVTKVIFYSATIYFSIYLAIGGVYEFFTGINKDNMQGYIWTGTSGAIAPLIIYLSSLIIYMQKFKNKQQKLLSLLSFVIVTTCVLYYDSRAAIFIIVLFSFVIFMSNLFRAKKAIVGQIFLIILFITAFEVWTVNFTSSERGILKYLPIDKEFNISTPQTLSSSSDMSRILIHIAAYKTIEKEFNSLLFGYGWYMARYKMIDSAISVRASEGLHINHLVNGKPIQPTGAAALLVDTGFIGVFLFMINVFFSVITILKSSIDRRYPISIIYLTMLPLFFVGNPTVMLLSYFMIMPNNPIHIMIGVGQFRKTNYSNTK